MRQEHREYGGSVIGFRNIRVAVAIEIGRHRGDLVEAGLNRLAGRATRTPAVQPALVKHKFRYDLCAEAAVDYVPPDADLEELERLAKDQTTDGAHVSPELADRINGLRRLRRGPGREGLSSAAEIARDLLDKFGAA